MNKEKRKQRFELTLLVSLIIFLIMFLSVTFSALVGYLLIHYNIISIMQIDINSPFRVILIMMVNSWIFGAIFAYLLSRFPLQPVNYFISQMNELTKGNFKTRLKKMPVLPNHPTVLEVTESFNKLAEELENTEMLRSDFINNFSHEFKTPIVSISGFAKLLKRGDLTEEQKKEYIDIIEEESLRLASMATNVLNMTKVENQTILTDVTTFNVSEQIRNCFLLLESKWQNKEIDFDLDFDEVEIEGNEEMLKHVWLNLIDNAIKFTNKNGIIEFHINESQNDISVSVLNTGSEIPEDQQKKIFNKFYQVDQSHSTQGNGIGLAVVKSVVDLHKGNVSVRSQDNATMFTVTLPKHQQ